MTAVPTPRADVQNFLDLLRAHPRPAFTRENIAELRPLAAPGLALIERPLGELAVDRNVTIPGPDGDLRARLFDARAERPAGPVVVYFHGGGFVIGDPDTFAPLAAEYARQLDLPVVSVDYRLAPEHPWPAAPDDAEAAARWLAASGAEIGLGVTGLVLAGDSAGATLALVTAVALRDAPAAVPAVLQVAVYPAADLAGAYPSRDLFSDGYGLDRDSFGFYDEAYAPDATHWRASPLHADLTGLAPTVVATAELDPLRDQGRAFAAKLVGSGVTTVYREAKGQIHGFAGFRGIIPSAHDDLLALLADAATLLGKD